jgi:hypothetical protein
MGLLHKNDTLYSCAIDGNPLTGLKQLKFMKLDINGNIISQKSYGFPGGEMYPGRSQSFQHNLDGGFSVCGVIDTYSEHFGFILKLDNNLDTLYLKTYQNSKKFLLLDGGIQASDGGFILTGEVNNPNNNLDIIVLRTDNKGKELWRKMYDHGGVERGYGITITPDFGYVITGYIHQAGISYSGDPFVLKLDSLFIEEWYLTLGTEEYDDRGAYAIITNDDKIAVGTAIGTYQASPHWVADTKIKIAKIDLQGNIIWDKTYWESYNFNGVLAITSTNDGSIVTTGRAWSDFTYGGTMAWILKVNSYGDSIWFREYGYYNAVNSPQNNLYEIESIDDGGFIVGGEAHRDIVGGSYPQTPWIVKVDSAGCLESGCDPTIGLSLYPINKGPGLSTYPNPFTTTTTIEYELTEPSHIQVTIYTSLGEAIYIAVDCMMPQGKHTFKWTANQLPEGLYYAVLMSEGEVSIIKMIKQ